MESGIQNRLLKSEIQPLRESGIHGCGIRNPQTWNPESTDMESGIRHSIGLPQIGRFVNSTPCLLADYEERPKEDESSNEEFAGIRIDNDEATHKEQGHRRQDERRTSAGKTYASKQQS